MPEYTLNYPCDWTVGPDARCGVTPTATPGDIYYACEEHYEEMRDWIMDDQESDEDA